MFTVKSNTLPTQIKEQAFVPLCKLRTNQTSAPLFTSSFGRTPLITTGAVTITNPPDVDGVVTQNISGAGFSKIEVFGIGGQSYTLAQDINNLQPGEFYFDAATGTIRVKLHRGTRTVSNATGTLIGERISEEDAPVETQIVTGLPAIFYQIPLEGTFSWQLGFEQQPQGSIQLRADSTTIDRLEATFIPGQELSFFGIGFRVASYNKKYLASATYPQVKYEISINLDGKWLNKLDKPIPYRQYSSPTIANNAPFQDSSCTIDYKSLPVIDKRSKIPLQEFAQRINAPFLGNIPEQIKIPTDVPPTATTTLSQEITPRLRQNNCFFYFSSNAQLEARDFDATSRWLFSEFDIVSEVSETRQVMPEEPTEITDFSGLLMKESDPTLPFPSTITQYIAPATVEENATLARIPSSAKYKNAKLEWDFAAEKKLNPITKFEVTYNNKAKQLETGWVRRYPIKETLVDEPEGSPEIPPAHIRTFNDLSLCWDNGGDGLCKTRTTTYLEDSIEISKRVEKWGFATNARELIQAGEWDDDLGPQGTPINYWTKVEEIYTFNYYDDGLSPDSGTGYYLGSDSFGWRLCRFKTESPQSPETFNHIDAVGTALSDLDARFINLYTFEQVPFRSRTRRGLLSFSKFYKNIDYSEAYSIQKVCNRDGTSYNKVVYNPTFVPPLFVAQEFTETICFSVADNPENTPDTFPKLPKYTTGKEEWCRKTVEILPSENTKIGNFTKYKSKDRYRTYTKQAAPQDPSYQTEASQVTNETNEGRPEVADRRPALYEFLEPEGDTNPEVKPPNFDVYLNTTNTPAIGVSQETLSYPYATSQVSAVKAATMELRVKDFTEALQTSFAVVFNPQIREGDRVTFTAAGRVCRRRVLTVSNQIKFLGKLVDGTPWVTSDGTNLTMGLDRDLNNFGLTEKKVNKPLDSIFVPLITEPLTLGEFVSDLNVPCRGNF